MFQLRHREVKISTPDDTAGQWLVQDLGHSLTPEHPSHQKLGNLLARHLLSTSVFKRWCKVLGHRKEAEPLTSAGGDPRKESLSLSSRLHGGCGLGADLNGE